MAVLWPLNRKQCVIQFYNPAFVYCYDMTLPSKGAKYYNNINLILSSTIVKWCPLRGHDDLECVPLAASVTNFIVLPIQWYVILITRESSHVVAYDLRMRCLWAAFASPKCSLKQRLNIVFKFSFVTDINYIGGIKKMSKILGLERISPANETETPADPRGPTTKKLVV